MFRRSSCWLLRQVEFRFVSLTATMLFVLDVGNTNTVLGVFAKSPGSGSSRYDKLLANWRVTTLRAQTVDEYGVLFRNLFSMQGLEPKEIHGIIVSSVVPPLDSTLRRV